MRRTNGAAVVTFAYGSPHHECRRHVIGGIPDRSTRAIGEPSPSVSAGQRNDCGAGDTPRFAYLVESDHSGTWLGQREVSHFVSRTCGRPEPGDPGLPSRPELPAGDYAGFIQPLRWVPKRALHRVTKKSQTWIFPGDPVPAVPLTW